MIKKILSLMALLMFGDMSTGTMEMKEKIKTDIYKTGILPAGAIKPRGWIREQLNRDLTQGYIGSFDRVHPSVTYDVFIKQDRLSKRKFGLRKEWWSGEHEGYWKDAVIRMAFLTQNKAYMQKAHEWMDELLANTGEEGYIGIYREGNEPDHRFNHVRGNGELWATSRMLMAMLAYYEYTSDERVFDAVVKATRLIMEEYADRNYFSKPSKGGGISHGVGFFEILEWLYRITGDRDYLTFAAKLYDDFNQGHFRDDDLKTEMLLKEQHLFEDHGAHIAEGLFVPEFIATINKENKYEEAADLALEKLKKHTTPGGAMRCDEFIKGREGSADERYEYCGITEMVSPINKIISFTGEYSLADSIETLTYNAGQGARFPVLTALSYFSKDNRLTINHRELIRRESYDAAHLAAVCCVLNGARLMPYFVEGMWMRNPEDNGITAMLFGPSEINTTFDDIPVQIVERTQYPFSDSITFIVNPAQDIRFPLSFRRPFGAGNIDIEAPENAIVEENESIITITHRWQRADRVKVKFNFDIKKIEQGPSKSVKNRGVYFRRGPLVYALPFDHEIDTVKEYQNSGFYRYKIKPENKSRWNLTYNYKDSFDFVPASDEEIKNPWDEPQVFLSGSLRNKRGEKEEVKLVPMGNTVFRRVTFSVDNRK